MIEGTEIQIGEEKMCVPALSLKQVRTFLPRIQTMKLGSFDPESMDVCIDVIHAALTRNYPETTRDEVEDKIDMRNMVPVFQAVMNMSGFESARGGEPVAGNQ